MAETEDGNYSDNPLIDDNVIRIQLRKPCQQKWELRTRNLSPGIRFPTIQLFDSEGNLLVETNDENVSIKTYNPEEHLVRGSRSLRERDFKHYIGKNSIRKRNSVAGDKIYTRIFRTPVVINDNVEKSNKSYVIRDCGSVTNIPSKLTLNTNFSNLQINSLETTPLQSDGVSEVSSYKSSDNESRVGDTQPITNETETKSILKTNGIISLSSSSTISLDNSSENKPCTALYKSQSFKDTIERRSSTKECKNDTPVRSKSGVLYKAPHNKVSFLNTYLKSLPVRTGSNPDWFALHRRETMKSPQNSREAVKRQELPKFLLRKTRPHKTRGNTSENEFINIPTDAATACEMKKRLKMYRRGLSEIEPRNRTASVTMRERSHSVAGAVGIVNTSSSESVDEADLVLNRLKRRILKNRLRERKRSLGAKYLFGKRFNFVFTDRTLLSSGAH